MKRAYHFVNETVEIEIEEKWDQVLKELDRLEYNNTHKETRRHSSLDDPTGKGSHIPSDDNLEDAAERLEEIETLKKAIATLGKLKKDFCEGSTFWKKGNRRLLEGRGCSGRPYPNGSTGFTAC